MNRVEEKLRDIQKGYPIVQKILREEKDRITQYNENSILNELEIKENNKIPIEELGTILGKILDKQELARKFIELIPLYFDEGSNWWMWDLSELYWKMIDEVDLLIAVNRACEVNVINSKERTEIINALKLEARQNKPQDLGSKILQFKKELLNYETGDRFPASPAYFVTNPIPFKLGKYPNTPNFDRLFSQWVSQDDVKNLYQIIAYCAFPAYPIERIFCLLGGGANGKSTFLKILYTFLGLKNVCTTNLDTLLKSRFETGRLYRKLACLMGETNLANIENSQLIKRLVSGKDAVAIEFKNRGMIDFVNYAKVIIATNNLPPTDDKTDGFYRRWLIIEFPNQFEKEIDVLKDIPLSEYENLAIKCIYLLDEIFEDRKFSNEGNIADRRKKYEEKSNPFDKFWGEWIDDSDPNSDISLWEFEKELNAYMKENNVRNVSDKQINKFMKEKDINQVKIYKEWYENEQAIKRQVRCWSGIKWKI